MQPRAGRKLHLLWLLLFALGCAVLYHVLAERQASVELNVQVEAPACFKIYWLGQDLIRANRLIRWWLWQTTERSLVRSWSITMSRLCLLVSRNRVWINSSISISV